jgi:hypothetical protein
VSATIPGNHTCDRINDIHTVANPGKYRVAKIAAAVVEKIVVVQVDEELRRCAVNNTRTY